MTHCSPRKKVILSPSFFSIIVSTVAFLFFFPSFATLASAHEVYVLTPQQVQNGFNSPGFNVFSSLKSSDDLKTFLIISFSILILLIINFIFRESRLGQSLDKALEKIQKMGPLIVRLTIATSFFFSAWNSDFLGPELPLSHFPFAQIFRAILFVISIMILLGAFTEIAALAAFVLYSIAVWVFGMYMITYLNYFGEIAVLIIFGSRFFSFDSILFGEHSGIARKMKLAWLQKYETTIVRIGYGIALVYAAVYVKLLHPILTLTVIKEYNLTRFHYLFPHDPLLVVLGAALAEITIGVFIVLGFELRMTVLISLFYITLSLLFFREQVWPHLMLYGISINLLINPERFSLDHFFDILVKRKRAKTYRELH